MKLTLTPELRVGIDSIDEQHKELLSRINSLFDALGRGGGNAQVHGMMEFLEKYVQYHFATEEGYMTKYGYPDLPRHRGRHQDVSARFSELKQSFHSNGMSEDLVMRFEQLLCDYLVAHISRADRAMAEFLKTRI